jgi:tRNA pseudouridine55 synthase
LVVFNFYFTVQGFLNLNKPFGFTSHDCIAVTRRLLKLKRVGHAGTLDPAATGVLPIALGKATRLLQYLQPDKAYHATIRLGQCTTTDDLQGEVVAEQPAPDLARVTVEAALAAFRGPIEQIPPQYSAIQVDGQRLYDLARAGTPIAVPARSVQVHSLEVLDWRSGEFPELELAIVCGAGTYIRSIARDLGAALQVGGTLAALVRTHSSGFDLADSLTFEQLEAQVQAGEFQPMAPEIALAHLESIALPKDAAQRWCQGQRVRVAGGRATVQVREEEDDRFLGIGSLSATETETLLVPQMVYDNR